MTVSLQPRAVTASPLILYQSPPLSGILLRKQLRHRKFSKVRISIPGGQIGVGQFLGLCKVVDMLRTAESELRHLISLQDRKSTRLNSSHVATSYAVVCL